MLKNLHLAWIALITVGVAALTGLVISLFADPVHWGWILVASALTFGVEVWKRRRRQRAELTSTPDAPRSD